MTDDVKLTLQLVRETKGTTELDHLQFAQGKLKILCTCRYFGALGIDYRTITAESDDWWLPAERISLD